MKKILFFFFFFLLFGYGSWFVYQKYLQNEKKREVLSVVPEDAVFILKTNNLTDAWSAVEGSEVWKSLIKLKGFESYQELSKTLSDVLLSNHTSELLLANRPTLMSAHLNDKNDYDFLYVIDLQNGQSLKKSLGFLLKLTHNYRKKEKEYQGKIIHQLTEIKNPENRFFITDLDNLLLISFNYSLIKKTLNEKNQVHWVNNPDFIKINQNLQGELIQFYFNFKKLPDFAKIYFTDGEKLTSSIAKQLKLSGFDVTRDENLITMNGFTLPDSIPSYFNALLDVKPGKIKAYRIITKRAAVYFSLGFKNFNLFYQSFLEQLSTKDKKSIRKQTRSLEKYLGINLQNDLFDWIGQEIAIIKINTSNKQRPQDILLAIQASDIEDARDGLTQITEQLRKRSPVKFKKYTYNNLEINYLHQKGFFKLLLGNMLNKIDKPYYTFIENYVVFSNSEKVLKDFIDDYLKGNTLSHDENFMNFKDEWNAKANLNLYVFMPKFYKILEKNLDSESKKSFTEKKEFLMSLSRINLQLISKDDLFKTNFLIAYDPKAIEKEQASKMESQLDTIIHNKFYEDLQFKISFPDSLHIPDGIYKKYYQNNSTIKIEGKVINGLPEGIWRTFYPDGKIESVVNYNNGEINGEAFFYYNKSPETKRAEMTFENNFLEGLYTEYWENGAVKAELEYKNGKLHGDAKYYYPNGKLKIKGKFKKGEKKGKWIFYSSKGEIMNKKRYSGFLF